MTVTRECYSHSDSRYVGTVGCRSGNYQGVYATVCYCDKYRCNIAAMTSSSLGHVIILIALLIDVTNAHLL